MRLSGLLLFLVSLHLFALCSAAPSDLSSLNNLRRAKTDLVSPTGYKISWTVARKRASFDPSAKGIGYTFLAQSGGITQALLNKCAATCTKNNQCGFFQLVQVYGGSQGTVVCGLHSATVVDAGSATYTTGPDSTGGTVVTTYGVRNLNPPSGIGSGSTPSTATTTTTTTTGSDATPTLPASPPGATLTQFKPACAPSYSVPMFVNNQFAKSTLTTAYIVQHGQARNFDEYFTAVYRVMRNNGIIVAPNFYVNNDSSAPSTWYQPSVNLAWAPGAGTWSVGADAASPSDAGGACSTFDIYDALLSYFSNKTLFPHLNSIVFVSHSWGANLVSRYSQIYDGNFPFKFRYIIANAANQAYFTEARPINATTTDSCSEGLEYPFQLVSNGMPRYVSGKFASTNANGLFQRWIGRDIITLIGNTDTAERYSSGVQDCGSQAQGGANRRERNYAWWAYQNILAGTGVDVSKYYGYQQLIDSGAKPLVKGTLNHQNCVVPGVGHNQDTMFASECGRAAMTRAKIPAGAGATYPESVQRKPL